MADVSARCSERRYSRRAASATTSAGADLPRASAEAVDVARADADVAEHDGDVASAGSTREAAVAAGRGKGLLAFYADHHVVPLPAGHRFPMDKYRSTRLLLQSDASLDRILAVHPAPLVSWVELQQVHEEGYLTRLFTHALSEQEQRVLGFPWSPHLLLRSQASCGGTVAATHAVLMGLRRAAGVLAGGTHHAFRGHGEGFCVFNDIAVAALAALTHHPTVCNADRPILALDLDVHQVHTATFSSSMHSRVCVERHTTLLSFSCFDAPPLPQFPPPHSPFLLVPQCLSRFGNGTASIFEGDPRVVTFSMHGANNYPWRSKRRSDYDVELPDDTGDAAYLSLLEQWLPKLFEHHRPSLVMFQAGVDALKEDSFGRLAMTRAGMLRRNNMVYSACIDNHVPCNPPRFVLASALASYNLVYISHCAPMAAAPPLTASPSKAASPCAGGEVAPAIPGMTLSPHKPTSAAAAATAEGPLSIVIFGASGDLAKKKTFPALFNLFQHGFLPAGEIRIFGYARSPMTAEQLREKIKGYLKPKGDTAPAQDPVADFLSVVEYIHGPYDGRDGYAKLQEAMLAFENTTAPTATTSDSTTGTTSDSSSGATRRLFYLALPPSVYPPVCAEVRRYCMNARGWTRVIVEKPFGRDLASAEALSGELGALFSEEQIYRIDHYLGKEVVQNLLVMRFANRFFVPLWNRENVANVQIVFREDFGTEGRGGYFDQYGIIRDIIQNHLMQVLCLVAMEKPVSVQPEDIRDEKVKVLRAIQPIREDEVVLGQYDGYTDDPTVPDGSHTPTFASLVLRIKNERWDGVPFIMKAGKALESRKAEIRVQFHDVPGDIFGCGRNSRDEFVMRLQPSEAMYMKLTVKKPGLEMAATMSELDLSYSQRYSGVVIPEAYERLILDSINGDQQHFVRRDELKAAWEIFTPLLHRIDQGALPPLPYKQGSRGPDHADELAERVGYRRTQGYCWIPPTLAE
ncbi:unnamed protein product [Closterium sp. NIES-64]|nr:unnamed protein product [Closterium sp. NIES-64]